LERICGKTAYEVLSDEDTRSIYDRYGSEGLKQHEAQKQGGGHHHNPFDMFSQFFGAFVGFLLFFSRFPPCSLTFCCTNMGWMVGVTTGGQRQQEKRGPSMLTTLEVDLADMYNGKHIEVRSLTPCSPQYRPADLTFSRPQLRGSSRCPAKSCATTAVAQER
jgi:DnaJ-class molecular chaperone